MKILINGSAAKFGGAKTILETYVQWIREHDNSNEYIIVAGFANESDLPSNIRWVKKTTFGLASFLYTTLFIYFDIRRFSPDIIFSFNNINFLFSGVRRITYFHQLMMFNNKLDKTFLYKLAIKYFLKKTKFIVQSEYIKQLFLTEFGSKVNVVVRWPGFIVPESKRTSIIKGILKKHAGKKILICPYTSTTLPHKNFQLILSTQATLKEKNIIVLVTAPQQEVVDSEVIDCIGLLPKEELYALYAGADGMIFPSIHETLGLPIFEFAETGKPVLVYERDYIRPYYQKFNNPVNIILFNDDTFIDSLDKITEEYCTAPCQIYRQGEWEELFE